MTGPQSPAVADTSGVVVEEMAEGAWMACAGCNGMGIDIANDPDKCPTCDGTGNAVVSTTPAVAASPSADLSQRQDAAGDVPSGSAEPVTGATSPAALTCDGGAV